MADFVTKSVRSAIMSRIRGRVNKRTESDVVTLLRNAGIHGWRRHQTIRFTGHKSFQVKSSDGIKFKPQVHPDFSFQRVKVALFIDGCFWHGCPKCYRKPKSHGRFWTVKVRRNQERDRFQTSALKRMGWRVIRIRECALTSKKFAQLALRLVVSTN